MIKLNVKVGDTILTGRFKNKKSVKYIPSQIHDSAYLLDEYGTWDRVYYRGEYRQSSMPRRI